MEYYDTNMIKPVESLDNITGISASRRRQERKRKQQFRQKNQNDEQVQSKTPKAPDEYVSDNEGIDYIA